MVVVCGMCCVIFLYLICMMFVYLCLSLHNKLFVIVCVYGRELFVVD